MDRGGATAATSTGSSGRAAYYARLLPRTKRTPGADDYGADPSLSADAASSNDGVSRILQRALVPEDTFYRVVKESKLYSIIFSGAANESENDASSNNSDESVVVVQEITKHGARSSSISRGRRNSVYDPNAFTVKKMPEEVVASSGRLQCLFGSQNAVTWFVQLKHVENAYMILSISDQHDATTLAAAAASRAGSFRSADNVVPVQKRATVFLERVTAIPDDDDDDTGSNSDSSNDSSSDSDDNDNGNTAAPTDATVTGARARRRRPDARAFEATGRFYYRVLVPIELRRAPDLLAPVVSRHVFKNAEEIIECSALYRCPQSSVMFVKLAYEDGWLFETLNSGVRVLERLATEPQVQHGHFFYVVRIPVGIRVAPNIMAQRAGKGYKLHSIVEASQRFTPPGSKITYVRVCRDKSARCACAQSHHLQTQTAGGGTTGDSPRSSFADVSSISDRASLIDESSMADGDDDVPATYSSCHGGWIFETTMDGQVVLEPIVKPARRQVERLFYRVLEDVDVVPTPAFATLARTGGSSSSSGARTPGRRPSQSQQLVVAPASPSSRKKRLSGTLIECSERLVPTLPPATGTVDNADDNALSSSARVPEIAFVKLRHDVGWICERSAQAPYPLVLEQVQGFAVTRDQPTFYRVLVAVHLRSAPDFECPRLPGVPPMAAGAVFESCLQYTPPGSKITYVKVASDSVSNGSSGSGSGGPGGSSAAGSGWLFDTTPSGDRVLEAVDDDPARTRGKFYYRVVASQVAVLLSPAPTSEVVKYLFANTIFAAEMAYTLPRTQSNLTFVRLAKDTGWVQLDAPDTAADAHTLIRISEDVYNLYVMPPSWVSVGFPTRTWYKVPDETCRTVLAEETMLQLQIFAPRNVLASSSQGRENVAIARTGVLTLDGGATHWRVTLEEIKHAASALLFTFPWKQVWWIWETDGPESEGPDGTDDNRHCVELQHGLRGGFRAVLLDGVVVHQTRSVTDMLWDAGGEISFAWRGRSLKVVIALEGAFFSQYLQFYSYALLVDEEAIVPTPF